MRFVNNEQISSIGKKMKLDLSISETIVYFCSMTFNEYIQTFHIKSFSDKKPSLWKIDADDRAD